MVQVNLEFRAHGRSKLDVFNAEALPSGLPRPNGEYSSFAACLECTSVAERTIDPPVVWRSFRADPATALAWFDASTYRVVHASVRRWMREPRSRTPNPCAPHGFSLRQVQTRRRKNLGDLGSGRVGMLLIAVDQDHEVVPVADDLVGRTPGTVQTCVRLVVPWRPIRRLAAGRRGAAARESTHCPTSSIAGGLSAHSRSLLWARPCAPASGRRPRLCSTPAVRRPAPRSPTRRVRRPGRRARGPFPWSPARKHLRRRCS